MCTSLPHPVHERTTDLHRPGRQTTVAETRFDARNGFVSAG
jgi:hypothetical protein